MKITRTVVTDDAVTDALVVNNVVRLLIERHGDEPVDLVILAVPAHRGHDIADKVAVALNVQPLPR